MIDLDTNVVYELLRPHPAAHVMAWLAEQDSATVWFTAVGEAELRSGVAILAPGRRRSVLAEAIEAAVRMAEWGNPRVGRLFDITCSEEWNTHCAQVAEIAVDRAAGAVRVHRVWCAVDTGIALQPANVAAQIESSIVYGIDAALFERLDCRGGEAQLSNIHDNRIMRMADTPKIETRVMPSLKDPHGGTGEVGLPPIAITITNAIAAGTGANPRQLPMTPERIKAAMTG